MIRLKRLFTACALCAALALAAATGCHRNQPPNVWIKRPADGTVFTQGQTVVLEGVAQDTEDGPLGKGAMRWSSDQVGDLGIGPSIEVTTLSPGPHAVTFSATDSEGETVSHTIRIHVTPRDPGF